MLKNENLYIVSAIGKDLTGLVSLITSVLYELNCNIIDVQQSVTHGYFSIFIIVDTEKIKTNINNLAKKVLEVGNQTNLKIIFEKFQEGRRKPDKKIMSVFLIGKDRPGIVAETATTLGYYAINIENIRMLARGELFIMEMLVDVSDTSLNIDVVQNKLKDLLNKIDIGVLFQTDKNYRKSKKLIIFDISTSLIEKDILNELWQNVKIKECLKQCKNLNNEKREIKSRAQMLNGIDIDILNQIIDKLIITADGEEIIRDIKDLDYKIALISTGYKIFTDKIKDLLTLDYTFSNIITRDKTGKYLTGEIEEPIIDKNKKSDIINFIFQSEGITKDDIVTIGDRPGNNIVLRSLGLFIKPDPDFIDFIIKIFNEKKISDKNLAGILCALGMYEEQ